MSRILHIFTAYYPSSKFEVYLDNELRFTEGVFDKMIFYPGKFTDSTRVLKESQKVVMPSEFKVNKWFLLWKYLDQIFKLMILEVKSHGWKKVWRNKSFLFRYLFTQVMNFDRLRPILKAHKHDAFYSNWSVDASLSLALLVEYGIINEFVTRAHRYDLYEEEYPIGFIPFRKYQQDKVKWIGSISADGKRYYEEKFPSHSNKVFLFRLGTNDLGISTTNNFDTLRIITCSNIKKVKRLHLLVQALQNCKSELEWHHFGDGDLKEEILKLCEGLPKNIKVFFHGRILADDLYAFYLKNSISCFINISSSEGIPVSIMEAISFGVPVIATDVGGTSEIINEQTGILLKEDFQINELTNLLNNLNGSKLLNTEFRNGVRNFWKENFNSEKCFPEFMNKLSKQ